jgi:hypothetical protein
MIKQTDIAVFLGCDAFDLSAAGNQCQAEKPRNDGPQTPLDQRLIM